MLFRELECNDHIGSATTCGQLPETELFSIEAETMGALQISDQELSRLADEAMDLAKKYWASVEERRAYPVTSGEQSRNRAQPHPYQIGQCLILQDLDGCRDRPGRSRRTHGSPDPDTLSTR